MPSYHCTSCDKRFETRARQPRCPQCLRRNGIEEIVPRKRKRKRSRRSGGRLALMVAVAVAITAAVAAAGTLLFDTSRGIPEPGELAVLDSATLERTLVARGVPATEAVDPFAQGKRLAELAPAIDAGEPAERAKKIAAELAGKLSKLRVDLTGEAMVAPRTADELADALLRGKAEQATSFELAALLAAALRRAELAALVAEVDRVEAPTKSADASGALGRFVVAIYRDDSLGKEPLVVLDPSRAAKMPGWAGGGSDATMKSIAERIRPLDDATAAAQLLGLRALYQIQHDPGESDRAYELSKLALEAAHRSATLYGVRALVLVQSGGTNDGVEAARRALSIRDDAPRHSLLAKLFIAQQDAEQAKRQLDAAIKKDPGYWPAFQTYAALRWMLGDRPGGNKHLARASKLAPDEPSVIALKASRMLAAGESEEAIALLRRTARDRPSQQLLLQLYMALLRAGDAQEAAKVKKRLLAAAGDDRRLAKALERIEAAAGVQAGAGGPAAGGGAGSGPAAGGVGSGPPSHLGGPDLPPPSQGGVKLPDIDLTPKQNVPGGLGKPDLKF